MTIHRHSINGPTLPGTTVGTVTLPGHTNGHTVLLRILDTDTPPGYRAVAGQDDTARQDGDAFISDENRIMNVLLVSADEASERAAAIRAAFRGFPLAHIKDENVEGLLWRSIRGEISLDGLQAKAAPLGPDAPDGGASNASAETVTDSDSLTADHTDREEKSP